MKPKFLLMAAACALAASGCTTGTVSDKESNLYEQFLTPPQEARPRVWWHWMDGNITKDGIFKDLLWMNSVGIGGFHHFDAGLRTEQVVDKRLIYMQDDWKDAFRYAIGLADSLGMEMAVASAPGWSSTGGPWVKPENAMKKLTWRETVVEGGQKLTMKLPEAYDNTGFFQNSWAAENSSEFYSPVPPEKYYEDIAVMAVKLAAADMAVDARVTSSGGQFTIEQLTDGDMTTKSFLPRDDKNGYAWIQYEYGAPVTVKAVSVVNCLTRGEWDGVPGKVSMHLQASDDGAEWRDVCAVPYGRVYRQTVSFPAATAKYFRMTFDNPVEEMYYSPLYMQPKPGTNVAELVLYTASKVNHAEEKAGFGAPYDAAFYPTVEDTGLPTAADVIDITDKVDADGLLSWDVPEGTWRIYRFGCSLTGKKNHPAPEEATGLEVDKLDAEAVRDYMTQYLDMYEEASGGMIGERGLQYILIDSYEAGCETWTRKMKEEFEARRGYSLLPWLPVLTGQLLESAEKSEQFLWDWRKTLAELQAENLYGQVDRIVAERGLKTYYEGHESARVFVADGMDVKKSADIPMAAIWTAGDNDDAYNAFQCDIRESASVAHIYGQNLVASESFTAVGMPNFAYTYFPGNLKPVADRALSYGLNRFVIHESAHQPLDSKRPGVGLMLFGQWFNRHETWAGQAKPWMDYLARSSFMLQQGNYVADILYYYGEDNCVVGLFHDRLPEIPFGYSFDYASADVLLTQLSCKGGRLVTKTGMSYRVLVLDENASSMSLPVLRRIAEFAKKGVTICGRKPERQPSLTGDKDEFDKLVAEVWESGKKNVMEGKSAAEALAATGVTPDFSAGDNGSLRFLHRTLGGSEIYWVCNALPEARRLKATFRTSGLRPEIWHPETGLAEEASYCIKGDVTEVALDMVAHDAVFVVFSGKAEADEVVLPERSETLLCRIESPWTVTFGEGKTATFSQLASYTESTDPDIKYFSGTATYKNTLAISQEALQEGRVKLKLGEVNCIAEVSVGGVELGTLWKAPYDIDITEALKAGENNIEVRVTNLWVNRIIGDFQPGCKNPTTYQAYNFYNAKSQLIPSGLVGPVEVFVEK